MSANHRIAWHSDGMPKPASLINPFDATVLGRRFDAFGFTDAFRAAFPNLRQDAASGVALARELEHLSQIVSQQPVADLNSFKAFPVVPDPPPAYSEVYTYKGVTYSKGRVSHNYDDAGQTSGNFQVSKDSQFIIPYIGHASYTIQDIGQAALTGMPIPAFKLAGERRAIEEAVNADNWFGNAAFNVSGLYDNSAITKAVVANGALGSPLWSQKTPDEIEADMTAWFNALIAQVNQAGMLSTPEVSLMPDRCILSLSSLTKLATTARSQLTNVSILQYLEETFRRVVPGFKFEAYNELSTGGGGGGTDAWGLMYKFDPMVAGRVVAMPTTFIQPNIEIFRTVIPVHAQAGGICVRYPVACLVRFGM